MPKEIKRTEPPRKAPELILGTETKKASAAVSKAAAPKAEVEALIQASDYAVVGVGA